MQRFELLGGKYQQGEQILPGIVQSFRAYEVPTGRPVFIHRVSSKEAVAQEIAGLLSAALIRSSSVRKMVVDVYEREPYRFVVTEAARQCVPLRDWLERESGASPEAVTSAPVTAAARLRVEQMPPFEGVRTEPARAEAEGTDELEETREGPDVEAAEFARMFRAALAGKVERARRGAQRDDAVTGYGATGEPTSDEEIEEEQERTIRPDAARPRVPVSGGVATPAVRPKVEPAEGVQASPPVAQASNVEPSVASEPELFARLGAVQKSGRSNLIVFLVVLGVLVAGLVMFVVLFAKR